MQRRTFLRTTLAVAGTAAITAPALAQEKNNGNGRGNNQSDLVNAEETGNGAIVATGDGFRIAGQDLTIDGQALHDGSEGAYAIYNDGYSGEITGNEITVEDMAANPTFGIRVEGGDVDVTGNDVEGDDALAQQFLSVAAADGARGRIEGNTLNGGHRVGILAEGSGTDASIRDNDVTGLGPKSDGWAENGIQVSAGASADVRGNTVADHWWDLDNFQSAGIILYQPDDDVQIQRNTVRDNDAGVALWGGDRHNAIHNTVEVTDADPGENGVAHYGVLVLATENSGVRQNTITAEAGSIGVLVYSSAENTKLIGNDVSGFDELIADQGADTKLPRPFDPDS